VAFFLNIFILKHKARDKRLDTQQTLPKNQNIIEKYKSHRRKTMKTPFIIYTTVICLTVFAVVGISHADKKVRVFEMADGNIVTFNLTAEEIAAQEAATAESKRLHSATRIKPKKNVLVFEMGESGITVSFPTTEREAAEGAENPEWLKLYHALSPQAKSNVEKVELPESGNFLLFPVSPDERDQTKQHYYSQKSH
jgi:hypothetical protein